MFDRSHIHPPRHFGEKAADAVARNVGSWRFVLIQNGMIVVWMIVNLTGWILQWDPWPFLFLNIIMSWQAANTGPILQMSSNRQAAKDRARDDLEAQEVETLYAINQEQMTMLKQQREMLDQQGQELRLLREIVMKLSSKPRAGDAPTSPAPSSGLGSEPSPPDAHQSTMSVKPA